MSETAPEFREWRPKGPVSSLRQLPAQRNLACILHHRQLIRSVPFPTVAQLQERVHHKGIRSLCSLAAACAGCPVATPSQPRLPRDCHSQPAGQQFVVSLTRQGCALSGWGIRWVPVSQSKQQWLLMKKTIKPQSQALPPVQAVHAVNTLNGTDLSGRKILVREDREDRDVKQFNKENGIENEEAAPRPRRPRRPPVQRAPRQQQDAPAEGGAEEEHQSSGLQVRGEAATVRQVKCVWQTIVPSTGVLLWHRFALAAHCACPTAPLPSCLAASQTTQRCLGGFSFTCDIHTAEVGLAQHAVFPCVL